MDNLRPDGRIPRSDYDGHVWYSDGDICAYVLDNLALDISGADMARLFAAAPDLLRACEAQDEAEAAQRRADDVLVIDRLSHDEWLEEIRSATLAMTRARELRQAAIDGARGKL